MPTPCYVSITGKNQGNITAGAFTPESVGNIYVEGHEDEMLVQAVHHSIKVPRDPQSGQPSGQRRHGVLHMVVALNKAVPLIYNAVASGEVLTEAVLKWYRTSIEGRQEHFFSTILTDSVITSVDLIMPHAQNEEAANFTQFYSIGFSYRKIEWEHIVAGTAGFDDWRKPMES